MNPTLFKENQMSPLLLVVIIVVIILAIVGVAYIAIQRVFARRAQTIGERFPQAKTIVAGANFFGQESRGVAQLRGNGTLVLTDSELYFELLIPRREFRIPLASIQAIETVSSHLGKTVGRPLLKVVFLNEAGQNDSIAWYVPDVEGLKQAIESARG
jgi:hypothetical protein